MRRINTTLSEKFYNLAKENQIKMSEALRIGISIQLSEMGITEYDNSLNIVRKLQFFVNEANRLSLDIEKRSKDTK